MDSELAVDCNLGQLVRKGSSTGSGQHADSDSHYIGRCP